MREYNLLTKKLLAEGYTVNNYPDYVRINSGKFPGDDPLNNIMGGFEYKYQWIMKKVFETPCGMQCKGTSCFGSLGYMGVDWSFENDIATVLCPYRKKRIDCILRHKLLSTLSDSHARYLCNVHMVESPYRFEGSVEEENERREEELEKKADEFLEKNSGRVCRRQIRYDENRDKWEGHYSPEVCANTRSCQYCTVLGRELDKKKGNVYYDIKISGRRYDLDGTLFEGQRYTRIEKGFRALDHPVSMDICRAYVKLCKDEVIQQVKNKYHRELFFAEYQNRDFAVEALNIRAESRPSRDLMQDLEDIQNGIEVTHVSDVERRKKKEKKEQRKRQQETKVEKLEKKIIEVGYENLPEYSAERRHARKWLTKERIQELQDMRAKRLAEVEPKQLSMFNEDLTEEEDDEV